MKEAERNKRVISSFKQFNETVELMENDEISTVIASLFIELERRGADRNKCMKSMKESAMRILSGNKGDNK
ncbi:hypothetical protein [Apilactobacillus kunkeei]|uniref:hypothetical protein n=1 Tax=Apilactobacillus kunkeei TaxID=148814 RepID=UPI00070C73DF|nr:hypothetical protein [Apilactobacillus kunkeei]